MKPGDRVMYGPYPATVVGVRNEDSVEILRDRDKDLPAGDKTFFTVPDALRKMRD